MNQPGYHENPYSGKLFFGVKLYTGTKLEAPDVYASTSGSWELCPCPGVVLQNTETIWVRPFAHSENRLAD